LHEIAREFEVKKQSLLGNSNAPSPVKSESEVTITASDSNKSKKTSEEIENKRKMNTFFDATPPV
jgi:hypothetical protein